MKLEDTIGIFQYQMTSEKIKQITPEQIKETYNLLHQNYIQYLEQLGNRPDNINDYFWFSKN
ncbi:hypothetical protein F6Y05_02340 [Bacillus megaterium]|nr:hypothetical protein [Priestia megaterium]